MLCNVVLFFMNINVHQRVELQRKRLEGLRYFLLGCPGCKDVGALERIRISEEESAKNFFLILTRLENYLGITLVERKVNMGGAGGSGSSYSCKYEKIAKAKNGEDKK